MRKRHLAAALAALLLLCACGQSTLPPEPSEPPETVDPYAGKVQVESGYGIKIWVKEYKDVPVNPLREVNVKETVPLRDEDGVTYETRTGIDVSEHQGQIDWAAVAASGVDFAIIRAGYRGYGQEGKLCIDTWFQENLRGAEENGIPVGLYFFSQATSEAEAEEEADFLLFLLTGHLPSELSLPVFFDWEEITGDTARTDRVDGETMTKCALAFCNRLEKAGYTPGIYAYRSLAYYRYDLSAIRKYPLWIGALGNTPDYYYAFDIWQHSIVETVPGIAGSVDLDLIFVPNEDIEAEPQMPIY